MRMNNSMTAIAIVRIQFTGLEASGSVSFEPFM
jgi:hypothetical protein